MNHLELTACAAYSKQAYSEIPGSQKIENRWTSTTLFWLPMEDCHYIVHRGSAQPRDFLIDGFAVPVRYLGNWVHGGFAFSHISIRKKLRKIFENIESSGKPLIVTGHSLGAAQGSLTLLYAQEKFPSVDARGYFFGKPRVYLKPGRRKFPDGKVVSCVCGSDLIARLPRYLFTAEKQELFYLSSCGNNFMNPDTEFVQQDFKLFDGILDHSMNTYLQRLKEIT